MSIFWSHRNSLVTTSILKMQYSLIMVLNCIHVSLLSTRVSSMLIIIMIIFI